MAKKKIWQGVSLEELARVRVYKGEAAYTAVIGQAVYVMNRKANDPQGINQYIGDAEAVDLTRAGQRIGILEAPLTVIKAIQERLKNE